MTGSEATKILDDSKRELFSDDPFEDVPALVSPWLTHIKSINYAKLKTKCHVIDDIIEKKKKAALIFQSSREGCSALPSSCRPSCDGVARLTGGA